MSNTGTWMQRTAQDWLVLTELTAQDATSVGITMAFQLGPQLLMLPWTGYAADRFNRRTLLMLTQGLMGALSLALGILTLSGTIRLWEVWLFAFTFGTVAAFDGPARQTFVAELTGDEDLPNAVALNSVSFNAGRMLGPVAGGFCIATVGTGWAFLLNGLSFCAVLISLTTLRIRDLHPSRSVKTSKGISEGFHYVWHRRDLRTIILMLFLIGTFGLNFPIFISTMAVTVFHAGAGRYGLLNSIMAIGTISGALLAAGRKNVTLNTLMSGSLIFGTGCLLAALAPTFTLFAAALALIGSATLTFTTSTNSLMQLSSAPEMRGRVMAIRLAVALGCTPVGAPLVGWVASHYGPRWALGLGAASGFAAALTAFCDPVTRARPVRRAK